MCVMRCREEGIKSKQHALCQCAHTTAEADTTSHRSSSNLISRRPVSATHTMEDYTLQLRCHAIEQQPTQHQEQNSHTSPAARSAHNCVLGPEGALYMVVGDSGRAGHRFSDTWRLPLLPNSDRSSSSNGSNATNWQQLGCSTARSNAAAAAAGDWLVLFGGWCSTGLEPLAHLEAFSFSTQTWHTTSLTPESGPAPTPRGQPAAAANTAGTAIYFFGGWDGSRRYNDLYKLHLPPQQEQGAGAGAGADGGGGSWAWELVQPRPAPPKGARSGITFQQQQQALTTMQRDQHPPAATGQKDAQLPPQQQQPEQGKQEQLPLPCERADHAMVCWHYCDDGLWKDLLVVFGGSSSSGLLNDTWLFDVNTSSWTQAYYGGAAAPCPRSSCAAAISGDILLLHGGQTAGGVLHDMHLLNLSTLTWLQVDLGPILQPLCRHSMVVSGSSCLIFGGYDGSAATNTLLHVDLQPVQQLQRSSLQDLINSMACCGSSIVVSAKTAASASDSDADTSEHGGAGAASGALKAVGVVLAPKAGASAMLLPVPPVVKALSKKAAPPPLTLSDLPNADEVARMPQWKQVRQLHQAALAAGCDTYIDPKSGYTCFTAKYLGQRQCCGNKCRHCPYGWANVSKARLQPAAVAAAPPPDW